MRRIVLATLWAVVSCCALQAQPKFDYFFSEAEKSRLNGDYSSAFELYRHCLDLRGDSPQVLYSMGEIYLFLKQDSLGLSFFQDAVRLEPGNPWYAETLASVYMRNNDLPNSIKTLEHLATLQTNRSDVLSQLSALYKSTGNTEAALSTVSRIELLEGKSPQLTMEKFSLLIDLERRDDAFAELKILCEEFPHDQNCKLLMANQYLLVGDSLQAKNLFEEVRQADPHNMNLQLSLVSFYKAQPDKAYYHYLRDSLLFSPSSSDELRGALMADYLYEARSDSSLHQGVMQTFDRLLAVPQKNAKLLTLKAIYMVNKRPPFPDKEVAQVLRTILQVEPDNQTALAQLMQYYASEQDYKSLEDICRLGVNYHTDDLAYHFYLGMSLYHQDKKAEAIDAFSQGVRIKTEVVRPKEVSEMFSVLGDLYYEQGKPEESFAAYDSSLVYNEDNLACLNNYAYYLSLRNERLDDAEAMSYRTVKAEPQNRTYLDTYAWILFKKADYNGARIYIDRVVSPESDEEELMKNTQLQGNVIEHAGDIYYMTDDAQTAVWLWTIALQKEDGTTTEVLPKKIRKKKYIKRD